MVRRLVNIDFWTDDKVVDRFTPEDKYFMLYLLTNPHTTQLGIYKLNIKYAAFETGYSVETIRALIDRFENHLDIIWYSPQTGEIAIKNFLIHSIIKGGKPVADLLWKEINDVKNKELISMVFEHIKDSDKINKTVRNIIDKYNNKYINENENENDKSYHDTSDESFHESSSTHTPDKSPVEIPQKIIFGQHKHVLLTKDEYFKLLNELGEDMTGKTIKFLDAYIESKNYQDNNHYNCIHRWVINAVKEREQRENRTKQTGNKFNNFEGRKYDMNSLERQMLQT